MLIYNTVALKAQCYAHKKRQHFSWEWSVITAPKLFIYDMKTKERPPDSHNRVDEMAGAVGVSDKDPRVSGLVFFRANTNIGIQAEAEQKAAQ